MLTTIQCSQLLHLCFVLLGASGSTIKSVISFPFCKKKQKYFCKHKMQSKDHRRKVYVFNKKRIQAYTYGVKKNTTSYT